ncbi:30S ribosomal protein S17 [Carex littledalei]|uniref:30S ribosomal protein S17, chloroplastic n=1 Tax=Carex littledalei TaxID=544730 RepID=A0A833RJG0_9POAL|nr:30S ribosomal protein S17 [Carex littledalei]
MLASIPFLQSSFLSNLSLSSVKPLPCPRQPVYPRIVALKPIHGKVICNTNDQTVNVRTIRYRIAPKYKKRVRVVRKFQAHDPENKFKIGDLVTLERCRPISKTKHHIAVPYVSPHLPKGGDGDAVLNLPLQSAQ